MTWKQKFIKRFITIWTVFSFIMCPLSLFAVFNTYVSIKYEVDHPRFMNPNPKVAYDTLEDHLMQSIYGDYWQIGFYLINGLILLYLRARAQEPATPKVQAASGDA